MLLLSVVLSSSYSFSDVTGTIKLRELYESPEQLLIKLDSLEKNNLQPLYKINFLRSYAYYMMSRYSIAYTYALSVMKDEQIKLDRSIYERSVILLAENAILSYRIEEACNIVSNGLSYAEKHDDEMLRGNMLFMEGLLYRKINNLEKSYEYLNKSIEVLSKNQEIGTLLRISQIMGYLCDVYIADNKLDEAWNEALKREKLISNLRVKGESLVLVDRQEAGIYSKLAFLSYRQERFILATDYYNKFLSTEYSKNKLSLIEINDYLLEVGRYQEVIDNNKVFFMGVDMDDVVSVIYQRALEQSARAYKENGDYRAAYNALNKLSRIKERHRLEINRQFVLDRYDTTEILRYKQDLETAELNSKRHLKLVMLFVGLSLIMLFLLIWVLYDRKRLNNKTRKIASLLLELYDKKTITEHFDIQKTSLDTNVKNADHEIFMQFDERVREDQLYLKYQMQRDDFTKIMGVDKNRFASILKEYAGGNLNAYLNDMRLEYSIHLLKNYPDMSIQEIGQASALPSSTTFYRLFKEKYGISPKAFRDQL